MCFHLCLGFMSKMMGYVIDSEIYAWVAVFVLPLNSATNPLLYTLLPIKSSAVINKLMGSLKIRKDNNTVSGNVYCGIPSYNCDYISKVELKSKCQQQHSI